MEISQSLSISLIQLIDSIALLTMEEIIRYKDRNCSFFSHLISLQVKKTTFFTSVKKSFSRGMLLDNVKCLLYFKTKRRKVKN